MSKPTISVIIPTLNAEQDLPDLLEALSSQSIEPFEILVIDSASNDATIEIAAQNVLTTVHSIDRASFNHGATRHEAFLLTSGDYVCFLTQDAIPANKDYLANLIQPLMDDTRIALCSGRQLPKKDARRFEQLVRGYNYPAESNVRSLSDVGRYGIKTFFASDVCSAYKRDIYLECGGFSSVNTNEDMLMAARCISAGYKIAYCAEAMVYHSHNLSLQEQFLRNKAIGVFFATHQSELLGAKTAGEGVDLFKTVSLQLFKEKRLRELFSFCLDCFARVSGLYYGKRISPNDN